MQPECLYLEKAKSAHKACSCRDQAVLGAVYWTLMLGVVMCYAGSMVWLGALGKVPS